MVYDAICTIYSAVESWHGQLSLLNCTMNWKDNGKKLKKKQTKNSEVPEACRKLWSKSVEKRQKSMAGMIRGKDRLEYMREELWMIKSRDATAELEMTEAEGKITGKEKIRAEDFFNFDQTSYDQQDHRYKLATQCSRLEVRRNYFCQSRGSLE